MLQEEIQKKSLITELEIGEKSGKIRNFNREENLKTIEQKFQILMADIVISEKLVEDLNNVLISQLK